MNGIHDMGGMHGMGSIQREAKEPAFHESWEARMFGMAQAMTFPPGFTLDRWRFLRELMPPAAYLSQSYYEHWYFICALALLEAEMASIEELSSGRAAPSELKREDAMLAKDVGTSIAGQRGFSRETKDAARFGVNQQVIARNMHPASHIRLPRYVRGKTGTILRWHGAHVFPDTNARGRGECPEHLYTVAFAARELWGMDAAPNDKVHLDL